MLSPAGAEIEVPSAKNSVTESVDGGCFGHGQAGRQGLYGYFLVPSTDGNRGCTDTSWCLARRETEAVQILTSWCQTRRETEAVQILTFWCQARRGTEAVQILLGAKHRGKLRLYRYLLVPSMEGY